MKKFLLICSLALSAVFSNAQSVSINTDGSTAAPSAMLDVKSTAKGLLIPRMTSAQRAAIPVPANGLMVYDTDQNKFYFYNGSEWITFATGSGSFSLPFSQTLSHYGNALEIYNQNGTAIEISAVNGPGVKAFSTNYSAIMARSEENIGVQAVNYSNYETLPAIYAENGGTGGTGIYTESLSGYSLIANGKLKIYGANTNPSNGAVLTSDATGNAVWKANKIAFHAKGISPSVPTAPWLSFTKVIYNQLDYDYGSNFLASDGSFTAPVEGVYHFDVQVAITINSTSPLRNNVQVKMQRAGLVSTLLTKYTMDSQAGFVGNNYPRPYTSISLDRRLLPGDKIWIEVNAYNDADKDAAFITDDCYFNGHLVVAN